MENHLVFQLFYKSIEGVYLPTYRIYGLFPVIIYAEIARRLFYLSEMGDKELRKRVLGVLSI
jgi:hypothetical protein